MDGIYLGWSVLNTTDLANAPPLVTIRYKGKLQQANDGNWIFRSISADGTVVGFQLDPVSPSWTSNENPATGTSVTFPISVMMLQPVQAPGPGGAAVGAYIPVVVATVYLQQQLPQEMTN